MGDSGDNYRSSDGKTLDWEQAEEMFPGCSPSWDALEDLVPRHLDFTLYSSPSGNVLWAVNGSVWTFMGKYDKKMTSKLTGERWFYNRWRMHGDLVGAWTKYEM